MDSRAGSTRGQCKGPRPTGLSTNVQKCAPSFNSNRSKLSCPPTAISAIRARNALGSVKLRLANSRTSGRVPPSSTCRGNLQISR